MSEKKTFADVVYGDIVYVAVGDIVLGEVVKYVEHFKKHTHIITEEERNCEKKHVMRPRNGVSVHRMPADAVLFTEKADAWGYLLDKAKKQYFYAANTLRHRKNNLITVCERMGLEVEDVIAEGV